jgi:group I intron endonuclease
MFIKGCMSGIYKITCLPTGKIYIGSSIHINVRWNIHKHQLRKNTHDNPYLQRAWDKYGENNFKFEIIEISKPNLLTENELKWFKKTNCCNPKFGFNIGKNPDRTMLGRFHTKESRLKISIARSGTIASKETKLKMSLAAKGRKKSKIERENISRRQLGSKNHNSKLNDCAIIEIRKLHLEGKSDTEIAKIFSVSQSNISLIINRKTWGHIS